MAEKKDVKSVGASEVKEDVKAAVKSVEKAATEAAKAVEEKAKDTAVKAKEVGKTAAKRAAAAKTTAKKTVAKKTAKKAEAVTRIVVEYQNNNTEMADIETKVKAQFVAEGHRAGAIKKLDIYVKPEDYAAYYVINEKFSGRVDLF